MKSHQIILLFLLSVLTISCVDDLTDLGSNIRPTSDEISIGTDTFHLSTENVFVDYMYARPDSFLLGTFYNQKFGTTQADILAQVNCPVDFKYPPLSVPDSALVVLYYKSWFGDQYAPLDINIYEMNKSTFSYTGLYPSNLNPADYTDRSILLGRKIFTAKDVANKRLDSTSIVIKLSGEFVQRFFNDTYYGSDNAFTNFFKGIYVTANYGASTVLNIKQLDLEYYYHYTYQKPGVDTLTVVKNVISFPANKEVRQVNRFVHPDRDVLVKQRDSVNFVASPANLQTRVNLPLARIKQKITDKIAAGKKQILNNAILKVEVTEIADSTLEMPLVQYMLLVKEEAAQRFFDDNILPTTKDTCALLGQLSSAQIGTTGKYEYYYSFDLAALIAKELKVAEENGIAPGENIKLLLIPVNVTTTTNSSTGAVSVTAVKQQYKMSAVTIRSGQNQKHPMKINMVYSGF